MRLLGCNGLAWIYGQFGGSISHGICAFCYTWNLLGVTVLHGSMLNFGVHQPWVYVHSAICEMYWVYWCSIDLWSIGGWSFCHGYMCNLLYVKLLGFNQCSMDLWSIWGDGSICHGYMCILLYVKLNGCNSFASIYGQYGGSVCHGYMCILLYVKLIGCNSFAWTYAQYGVPSAMGICAFCYTWNLLGCNSVAWIYGQFGGGSISHGYMCILLYMKLIGCNSFAWIYAQCGGMCPSAMGICAFCSMWNLLAVMV